ncbi:MAG: hypothetical protein CMC87_13125 [Flavobacteriaceae bacterium]|nr:hypothetical protein [Flavobacteriaceae bacterium]|tara:strand:- start:195 stop:632 length:438 start_codon:yes stop_codon:yes gene_type:complete
MNFNKLGDFIKSNLGLIIPISILLSIIIYAFISNYSTSKAWSNPKNHIKYSVATILDYEYIGKSPDNFIYRFQFKGNSYESSHMIISNIGKLSVDERRDYIGKRFYVKFIEQDPDHSKLLINYEVADSITKIPDKGWDDLPQKSD